MNGGRGKTKLAAPPRITPQRWDRIGRLFAAALEYPPDERPTWLKLACGDDQTLLSELETLLAAHAHGTGLLDAPALQRLPKLWSESVEARIAAAGIGTMIGPYRLLAKIADGGMSTVYLAEYADRRTARRVALKVMHPGFGDSDFVHCFMREQQVLATLEHPGIARLYEAGANDEGRPWFAMEYVRGEPVDEWCARRSLGVEERLRLFMQVGAALSYAHHHLVLHLDIKPANVLINAEGEAKLLDFGIAGLLAAGSDFIRGGRRFDHWLTPEYAAPEQVRGEALSTATDVYALGGLLHRVLTGEHPLRPCDSSPEALERTVCETLPVAPSAALGAGERGLTSTRALRRARRRLQGDLDAIVLTALRKEPHKRYASVEALMEDVWRHLEGKPIKAREDTLAYRTGKFASRHKRGLGIAAATLALIIGLSTVYLSEVSAERNLARQQAAKANAVSGFLTTLFDATDPYMRTNDPVTLDAILDRAATRVGDEFSDAPETRAQLMSVIGRVYSDIGRHDKAEPLLRTALDFNVKHAGGANVQTADALQNLGLELSLQARYAEAEPLFQRALVIYQGAGKSYDPQRALLLNDYSMLLPRTGRRAEAERILREALRIPGAASGPAAVRLFNNLAFVLEDEGKLDEAVAIERQVLERELARNGEHNIDTAEAMTGLAFALERKGEFAGSEALLRRGLRIRREMLPPDHPEIAAARVRLAWVLDEEGKGPEGEKLGREGATGLRAILSPGDWQLATADGVVGLALVNQGRYAEAEKPLLTAYRVSRMQFGSDDWRTISMERGLFRLYTARGMPELAARYCDCGKTTD